MPQPDLNELISVIDDDYIYVRSEGKWKSNLVFAQKASTQVKDALVNFINVYVAPYVGLGSTEPTDKANFDITKIKIKICKEVKEEFKHASESKQIGPWFTVCKKLGKAARDENSDSLLCKALHTNRIKIIKKIREEKEYKDHIRELYKRKSELDDKKIAKDKFILDAKADGYLIDPKDEKEQVDIIQEQNRLLLELADLGDKRAIIQASEKGFLPYLKRLDPSEAPTFPYDPKSSTPVERNVHMPLAYQDFYPEIFKSEIESEKKIIDEDKKQSPLTELEYAKIAEAELQKLEHSIQCLSDKQIMDLSQKSSATSEEIQTLGSIISKADLTDNLSKIESAIQRSSKDQQPKLRTQFTRLHEAHTHITKSYNDAKDVISKSSAALFAVKDSHPPAKRSTSTKRAPV